jgi:hypothetical protein
MELFIGIAYIALFILVLVTIILGVQYFRGKIDNQVSIDTSYPPTDYMISQGLLCPDWWKASYDPANPNQVTCKNIYGLSVGSNTNQNNVTCATGTGNTATITFPQITQWPPATADGLKTALSGRCDWVNNCGQGNNTASWMAIQNLCGI